MTQYTIIGIDGGASKVSGYILEQKDKDSFVLSQYKSSRSYSEYQGFSFDFTPLAIQTQLCNITKGYNLSPSEQSQAKAYVQATADIISELYSHNPEKPLLIGMGLPGLKTDNKRGIAAMANGPRMPHFCDELETLLAKRGIKLAAPVARLGSDADYCGMGEEYAESGLFRNSENAYYLGGGTGVADAIKLNNHLLPFDEIKFWMAKSWEMKNISGITLENYASAGGIQKLYSQYSGRSLSELNKAKIYPVDILMRAENGEPAAIKTIDDTTRNLTDLLFERMMTLYFGWQHSFSFVNPGRGPLRTTHPYMKTLLDRIVIGQRLADVLEASKSGPYLWNIMSECLTRKTLKTNDDIFMKHYLKKGVFDMNFISLSSLKEAPALGAGIDAVRLFANS